MGVMIATLRLALFCKLRVSHSVAEDLTALGISVLSTGKHLPTFPTVIPPLCPA